MPRDMDTRTRLRLKHEKQVQEKYLALWSALQKTHKAIAARKPRGTYQTTQQDYWLEAFIQIFPDMPDCERAARLLTMEGLKVDGKGWDTKWRSFASVQVYKPEEAKIDATIWKPIFIHLSKDFENLLPKSVAVDQPVHPTTKAAPVKSASIASMIKDKKLPTLQGFEEPKFDFLTNKQLPQAMPSTSPTAPAKTSSPSLSVLQQPLPAFSTSSLFGNLASDDIAPKKVDPSKKYDKTVPFGLHKPRKDPALSNGIDNSSPFVFDTKKLAGTIFTGRASTSTTPFIFKAGSEATNKSEGDSALVEKTHHDSREDSVLAKDASPKGSSDAKQVAVKDITETPTKESALKQQDLYLKGDTERPDASSSDTTPEAAPDTLTHSQSDQGHTKSPRPFSIEVTIGKAGVLFEDDAMYGEINAYDLLAQCKYDASRAETAITEEKYVHVESDTIVTSIIKVTIGQAGDKFDDDAMHVCVSGYELLAQRDYDLSAAPSPVSIEIIAGTPEVMFEDDVMYGSMNGYELLAQRDYELLVASSPRLTAVDVEQIELKFEDDVMYGNTNGYDLLAQREYHSVDASNEAEDDVGTSSCSNGTPVSSPLRPLTPEHGMYCTYDVSDGKVSDTYHYLPTTSLEDQKPICISDIDTKQINTANESPSPTTAAVHPFGSPGPLPFDFGSTDETEKSVEVPIVQHEQTIDIELGSDGSEPDPDQTLVASDDEDLVHAKTLTKTPTEVQVTKPPTKLYDAQSSEDMNGTRDWAKHLCDGAFGTSMAPQLPVLQLQTASFSSLFDSDMLSESPKARHVLQPVLPELSELLYSSSPKTTTNQVFSVPEVHIPVSKSSKLEFVDKTDFARVNNNVVQSDGIEIGPDLATVSSSKSDPLIAAHDTKTNANYDKEMLSELHVHRQDLELVFPKLGELFDISSPEVCTDQASPSPDLCIDFADTHASGGTDEIKSTLSRDELDELKFHKPDSNFSGILAAYGSKFDTLITTHETKANVDRNNEPPSASTNPVCPYEPEPDPLYHEWLKEVEF